MQGNFFRGVVLGSVTAVLVLSATTALAGTGVGGIFNLGQSNTVNATSSLSGSTTGSELLVSNTSTAGTAHAVQATGAGTGAALVARNTVGSAAVFITPSTSAPFTVGSTKKVASLNADLLDGLNSTAFLAATGTAANASKLGGLPSATFFRLRISPLANAFTTLDANSSVGTYTSATVGADGLPLISYFDSANGHLKVVHCSNAACSSGVSSTVDSSANSGFYTSVTIGRDGLPLISYYAQPGVLKVAHCGNLACSSGNTLTTVDSSANVGEYTSVAIGADGLPVISYYDVTNGDLKVAHCGNVACSSGDTAGMVDGGGDVGFYTSVTIGADRLPLISYYDFTNLDLKVVHCGNAACNSVSNTITSVDTAGDVGRYTSATIGADGLPLISYYDATNGGLVVAHCLTVACDGSLTTTSVDSTDDVGSYSSVTVGTDGLPLIVYQDTTNGLLKAAHCGTASCSSAVTTTLASGGVGRYGSVTIGADGLPLISYYDDTAGHLKVAHCANTFCVPYFRRR